MGTATHTTEMGKGRVDGAMLGKIGAGCAVLSCCCVCLGLFLPYIFAINVSGNNADVTQNQGLFGIYMVANNGNDNSKNTVSCFNEDSGCSSTDDTTKYVDYGDIKGYPDDYCDTGSDWYKQQTDSQKSFIDGICTGRGLYVFFFVLAIITAIAAAVGAMKGGMIMYAA